MSSVDIARPSGSLDVDNVKEVLQVPDDDRIPWRLPKGWQRVARALRQGQSPETVTDSAITALACSLRSTGGIPALPDVADCLSESVASGARSITWPATAMQQANLNDLSMWRRAQVMLITHGEALAQLPKQELQTLLALETIKSIARRDGFDRIVPPLIAEAEVNIPDMYHKIDECLHSEQMKRLAARLVRRPEGSTLKAPPRITKKEPTAELIGVNLLERMP